MEDPQKKKERDAKRLSAFGEDPHKLTIVGLDTTDGPEHPLYDKRVALPLDEGLVKNIMKFGVKVWVLVRKNGLLTEVVDGRQRVRATREANRRLVEAGMEPHAIPCSMQRSEDIMGVMLSGFVRQDDTVLLQAQKIQRYLETGKSEVDASIAYGIPLPLVKSRLALLDLSPKVQTAIQSGKIAATAALELRDLTHGEQDAKLAKILGGGNGAGAELKRQREGRKQGADPVVRSKNVSRTVLRRLSSHEDFIERASPETQALLSWILGEGKGGKTLWSILRKVSGGGADDADGAADDE